jgi:outer membrane protein assembly factor BamB
MRRRLAIGLLALLVLAAAGGAAAWWWNERQTKDVRGSAEKEFVETEEPGTTRPEKEVREEPWPTYGFNLTRTRFAPDFDHRPPYRRIWTRRVGELMEFPPVVAYGRLYVATFPGTFLALEAETGGIAWKEEFGRITAASPTVGDGVVYQPLMNAPDEERKSAPGFLVALKAETGEELWRFKAGVIESSPLLVDGVLYFGTFDDKLYALDARTRKVRWTYKTGDDVKGGPVFFAGAVYFGSYDGNVYAVDAKTGKLRWSSEAQGGLRGAGNFYATPAVAYGRVFIGNTDGKVYAFGAKSGDLLWSRSTGGYVYSSAAVWNETVYVGSYDERLYALDAATGDVRWSFKANERVSGAPTVLAGVVYFATLGGRTYALDARSGARLWTFPDGRYTPIVADEERVYLTGWRRVYGLEPSA